MRDREELAFPSADGPFGGWNRGMTLRDWFAGQALAGLAASPMDMPAEAYGLTAYAIADAMLAAREQKA